MGAGGEKYLKNRGGWWHYERRVPRRISHLDKRGLVRVSLHTNSIEAARAKRDHLAKADAEYWDFLTKSPESSDNSAAAEKRYAAAKARAQSLSLTYKTTDELIADDDLPELINRLSMLGQRPSQSMVDAVLGTAGRCEMKVSAAFQLYIDDIAASDLLTKSPKQRQTWEKVKRRAVNNFIRLNKDVPMDQITRDMALVLFNHWKKRITEGEVYKGQLKLYSPSAGNRDVGNMRKLYNEYFRHIGDETRSRDENNPFRDLRFKDKKRKRPAFKPEWLQRIIRDDALAGLNEDARYIIYILCETGCRPSEICNLQAPNIRLADSVPHIFVTPTDGYADDGETVANREVKTTTSRRKIPLVGIALEAMQRRPDGFPRYFDREDGFSQAALKYFRHNNLFPTSKHVIYSLRHTYEDRMKLGRFDAEMRQYIFGHSIGRSEYGDGDLGLVRGEMERIKLDFPPALFARQPGA